MIALELQLRFIENKDWATVLFVLAFALLVVTKTAFENRFRDFTNLLINDS